jgi:hypothetical protein
LLQVFGRDGSWVPITPSRHQLVVLVGHTLSWATAGRLPAALHRVVLPDSAGSAAAAPRLSLAFKLQADPHAVFDPASIAAAADVQLEERYVAASCLAVALSTKWLLVATQDVMFAPATDQENSTCSKAWILVFVSLAACTAAALQGFYCGFLPRSALLATV